MEVLGSAEWSNLSEDYEGMADVSSVELVLDGGKTFLVLRFNTDFECVAEDLGMTLV